MAERDEEEVRGPASSGIPPRLSRFDSIIPLLGKLKRSPHEDVRELTRLIELVFNHSQRNAADTWIGINRNHDFAADVSDRLFERTIAEQDIQFLIAQALADLKKQVDGVQQGKGKPSPALAALTKKVKRQDRKLKQQGTFLKKHGATIEDLHLWEEGKTRKWIQNLDQKGGNRSSGR